VGLTVPAEHVSGYGKCGIALEADQILLLVLTKILLLHNNVFCR
jgi:hypothetical protein